MNDLDQLKELLFGNEKKALDALVRRLEVPESRINDVADVLPEAVTRSYNQDERLGRALSQPVEYSISEAIRREPKKFADALFPIMGPAIRKSIAEAIKSLLQSINNATSTSLSPSARFSAWRAGVPFGQWVLSQSLVYRVDQVYLIDPESGLLVSHLHHPEVETVDEEAVSAMLTAVQDFIRDSFVKGEGGGLDSAVIGEFTVWISQGPHAMLACVIRGVPPVEFKTQIASVNEHVHLRHTQDLQEFDGRTGSIGGLDLELETLLQTRLKADDEEDNAKRGLNLWALIPLLALLGLGLYWFIAGMLVEHKMGKLAEAIEQAPGLFATQVERDGLNVTVRGLRDPLAADPMQLATGSGLKSARTDLQFLPFQSLEMELVESRLKDVLLPPEGVTLRLDQQTLFVEGSAPVAWQERLQTLAPVIGGVTEIDTSGLRSDDASLLLQLKEYLTPPESVSLSVNNGVALVAGEANAEWRQKLANVQVAVPGLVSVNSEALRSLESVQLKSLYTSLDGRSVGFPRSAQLAVGQDANLLETVKLLNSLDALCEKIQCSHRVKIVGHADDVGTAAYNEALMLRRATVYRDALSNLGAPTAGWLLETATKNNADSQSRGLRRAELRIVR